MNNIKDLIEKTVITPTNDGTIKDWNDPKLSVIDAIRVAENISSLGNCDLEPQEYFAINKLVEFAKSMQWQPIETAPQGIPFVGAKIIDCLVDEDAIGKSIEYVSVIQIAESPIDEFDDVYAIEGGEVVCKVEGKDGGYYYSIQDSLAGLHGHNFAFPLIDIRSAYTHWMPLP